MSFDTPGWNDPDGPAPGRRDGAAERVKGPAVFLIIVGILNLLLACGMLVGGMMFRSIPDEQFREMFEKSLPPEQKQVWEKQGLTPEALKAIYAEGCTYWGVAAVLAGAVILFGGARMLVLRSYGFAVVSALVALVPGLACCCGLSQGIGIWALVVLFSPDVREAFR
jgi:hypothetical protein